MAGLYFHIPFCRRKCLYCDFYSVGDRLADWQDFVSALIAEAHDRLTGRYPAVIDTLYIGGGTPSLMPADEFSRLVENIMSHIAHLAEFTIEVNPDDVNSDIVAAWSRCGVNRISMGIQSFVDSELKAIGRRHDARTALDAYDLLRNNFENVSIDLMFGLPGQTRESFEYSVNKAIELNPEHISAYSLMYEERTALTRLRDSGTIDEAPEELSTDMFAYLTEALEQAGYEQYEISNYAHPGFQSKHNSSYWQGKPYTGLGPGAHSYDGDRTRRANLPDLKAYLLYWLYGKGACPCEKEVLDETACREEMIMTRLRTRQGLDLNEFAKRFSDADCQRLLITARRWIDAGYLIQSSENSKKSLSLTRSGIMISDEIISDLF